MKCKHKVKIIDDYEYGRWNEHRQTEWCEFCGAYRFINENKKGEMKAGVWHYINKKGK
jgi:hypothetical protein